MRGREKFKVSNIVNNLSIPETGLEITSGIRGFVPHQREKGENRLKIFGIKPIPYKNFPGKLDEEVQEYVFQDFGSEYAVVWQVGYRIGNSPIKSILASTPFFMALSANLFPDNNSYPDLIPGVPLLSGDEFSVILDLYAAREAHNLMLKLPETINRILNSGRYYCVGHTEMIKSRIRSFLPSNFAKKPKTKDLERIVVAKKGLEEKSVAYISKLVVAT